MKSSEYLDVAKEVTEKAIRFIQTHPIPPIKKNKATINFTEINRALWYCNWSGLPIPELNANHGTLDFEKDFKCKYPRDRIIFENGYNKYRVYPCGHCVYEAAFLCSLYDRFNYYITEEDVKKKINSLIKCPICKGGRINTIELYAVSNELTLGTINLTNIIPIKYINTLASVFQEGTIVDVEGYRGTGLYYLKDKKFVKVPIKEYYPLWPKDLIQLRGYMYCFSVYKFADSTPFENISWSPMGMFVTTMDDLDDDEFLDQGCIEESFDLNLCKEMNYPFKDHNQANQLLKESNAQPLYVKISEIEGGEYLVFHKKVAYITNCDGSRVITLPGY